MTMAARATAYHDTDEKNEGGAYREDGVDIEATPDGKGYCVGYTQSGEWMEYTINVAKDAKYNFAANVATGMEDGAAFSISIDGTSVASVNVPYTNDWKTYTAVKGTAGTITAGNHVLRNRH
jgi:beta-galactosidase